MSHRIQYAACILLLMLLSTGAIVFGQTGFGTGWTAQYFNNTTLEGSPVFSETLPDGINFNYGTDSPNPLVQADNFTARFTSVQTFTQGVYEFIASSDDGVRVYIDNVLVLDRFIGRVLTTDRFQQSLSAGSHSLTVEYLEVIDQAAIQFQWFRIPDSAQITPTPPSSPCEPVEPPFTSSADWTRQFFNNTELSGTPVYSDIMLGVLNSSWGTSSPNELVTADNFSARFTSAPTFAEGTYDFYVASDDGVRVFIDSVLVLDRFYGRVLTADVFQIPLSAGVHTVTVDYLELIDNAIIQVSWYPVGQIATLCGTPEPAENFLAENLANRTNDAIIASGGTANVGENDEGNTYSHAIVVNGAFVRSPGEIGVQGLIDRGVLQAVDLFGLLPNGSPIVPFNSPVRVCLHGEGELVFLNAADEPRIPTALDGVTQEGYTCADVSGSGTVVLIKPLESTPVA